MVTFVTALVLTSTQYRPLEKYIRLFESLAESGVSILVYLDDSLKDYGDFLTEIYPNVRVVEYVTRRPPWIVKLPANRNLEKDTIEYMQIQLRKLEFVADALQYTEDEFLAWIDFGIFHMARDADNWKSILRRIASSEFQKERLLTPGCWERKEYSVWDSICWRFCGSFVLGHRSLFQPAFKRQSQLVVEGLPNLTWEVNYWTQMEEHFQVYTSNHDDSLLEGLLEWTLPK